MVCIVDRVPSPDSQLWQHDEQRRIVLRIGSRLFRWFEPLCEELYDRSWLHSLGNIKSIEKSLARGGAELPWNAKEYLSVATIRMLLASLFGVMVIWQIMGATIAVIAGSMIGLVGMFMVPRQLSTLSDHRMRRFKQRLPFAVDLMALMMEAGGDFRQCLSTVVHENRDHPVGQEFDRISKAHSAGQPLRECLDQLQSRLQDEDVNEMVFSIKNAEELGVPLSKTFLTLAEQMRLKRAQQLEKLIGERKTMMAFPSLIIMIACLLVAVTPFVLGAIYSH
jgi:tight adherence protein C